MKGQISLVLNIVVIVLIMALVFMSIPQERPSLQQVDRLPAQALLDSCLRDSLTAGLSIARAQGALAAGNRGIAIEEGLVPYYLDVDKPTIPSKETIAQALEVFIIDDISSCIAELPAKSNDPIISVVMTDTSVSVTYRQLLTFTDHSSTFSIDASQVSIPTDLIQKRDLAATLVGSILAEGDFCMTCFDEIMDNANLIITPINEGDASFVFAFDEFQFAIQLNPSPEIPDEDKEIARVPEAIV